MNSVTIKVIPSDGIKLTTGFVRRALQYADSDLDKLNLESETLVTVNFLGKCFATLIVSPSS